MLWISMLTILFINYKYFKSFSFLVMASLTIAYFFVYVITPNDLKWHLATSFDRLVHQVFPVLMYSVFMSFGDRFVELANKNSSSSKLFMFLKKINDKF